MLPHSPEISSIIPFTDILLHNNCDKIEHKICNSNTKENFVHMYYYPPPGLRFGLVVKNSYFSHCCAHSDVGINLLVPNSTGNLVC